MIYLNTNWNYKETYTIQGGGLENNWLDEMVLETLKLYLFRTILLITNTALSTEKSCSSIESSGVKLWVIA